jgi:hypothetical protein
MITINSNEHYFISQWKPRELLNINLGLVRLLIWGPWPFISLTIGLPGPGDLKTGKQHALQVYAGIKSDPSKMDEHPLTGYWMRLDLAECFAARWHPVAKQPSERDQGGA